MGSEIKVHTKARKIRISSLPGLRRMTSRVNNLNATVVAAITVKSTPITTTWLPFDWVSLDEDDIPDEFGIECRAGEGLHSERRLYVRGTAHFKVREIWQSAPEERSSPSLLLLLGWTRFVQALPDHYWIMGRSDARGPATNVPGFPLCESLLRLR